MPSFLPLSPSSSLLCIFSFFSPDIYFIFSHCRPHFSVQLPYGHDVVYFVLTIFQFSPQRRLLEFVKWWSLLGRKNLVGTVWIKWSSLVHLAVVEGMRSLATVSSSALGEGKARRWVDWGVCCKYALVSPGVCTNTEGYGCQIWTIRHTTLVRFPLTVHGPPLQQRMNCIKGKVNSVLNLLTFMFQVVHST